MRSTIARLNIVRRKNAMNMGTLSFNKFGNVSDVLSLTPKSPDTREPQVGQIKISAKTSQVLSEDIRNIKGVSFGNKTIGVAGTTAVGIVTAVAEGEIDYKINDTVLVVESNLWTDHAVVAKSSVTKLSSISADEAATLPTFLSAWALLNNFVKLNSGDTVIQSSGSSALGSAVSQMGKALGVNVISPSASDLSDPKFVSKTKADKHTIKLSISDRSGRTSLDFARITANDGTLVVYNGVIESLAESEGVDQSAGSAIYKNVSIAGFDFGLWYRGAKADGSFQKALDEVLALGAAKKLILKPKVFAPTDFQKALAEMESTGSAVVLKF